MLQAKSSVFHVVNTIKTIRWIEGLHPLAVSQASQDYPITRPTTFQLEVTTAYGFPPGQIQFGGDLIEEGQGRDVKLDVLLESVMDKFGDPTSEFMKRLGSKLVCDLTNVLMECRPTSMFKSPYDQLVAIAKRANVAQDVLETHLEPMFKELVAYRDLTESRVASKTYGVNITGLAAHAAETASQLNVLIKTTQHLNSRWFS